MTKKRKFTIRYHRDTNFGQTLHIYDLQASDLRDLIVKIDAFLKEKYLDICQIEKIYEEKNS